MTESQSHATTLRSLSVLLAEGIATTACAKAAAHITVIQSELDQVQRDARHWKASYYNIVSRQQTKLDAAAPAQCLHQISEPSTAAPMVLDDSWKHRLLDGRALARDEMGFGDHPELPVLDEAMKPAQFFAALGIELQHTMAEDQMEWEELDAMSDASNWSAWTPQPPSGDNWKLVAIFDTEDGLAAWWLREPGDQDAPAFPVMTPELHKILGTMCFQCISTAQALRAAGHQIKSRAEDEQAATLHWMLGHYFKHGENWRASAIEDMKRMEELIKNTQAATQAGGTQ